MKSTIKEKKFDWYYAVSQQVYDLLQIWECNIDQYKILIFEKSPARSKKSRKLLLQFVKKNEVELVYTMSGPAYVKFPVTHILGISNAYITHASWESFRLRGGFIKTIKYYFYALVQFYYSLKADYFIFQTNYAKDSFKKRAFIKEKKLTVIPNAYDSRVKDYFNLKNESTEVGKKELIRIFCPGAHYPHKGLQFIPEIIHELEELTDIKFLFILTLPKSKVLEKIEKEVELKKIKNRIENIGPYNYDQIISLLEMSDIIFIPSLLETFSASYLEAMCAQKPLVVANKPFAKDICKSYAYYVDLKKPKEVAAKFVEIFSIPAQNQSKTKLAEDILTEFGNQEDRFEKISRYLQEISKSSN